jgi:hypothetical protein
MIYIFINMGPPAIVVIPPFILIDQKNTLPVIAAFAALSKITKWR